jgi:hypothetical protein
LKSVREAGADQQENFTRIKVISDRGARARRGATVD